MRYLALLTLATDKTTEQAMAYLVPELKHVWESYKTGRLREICFSHSPPVVSIFYEVPDLAAVHAELDALPMIQAGMLDRQVVALEPFVQFEALFGTSGSAA